MLRMRLVLEIALEHRSILSETAASAEDQTSVT